MRGLGCALLVLASGALAAEPSVGGDPEADLRLLTDSGTAVAQGVLAEAGAELRPFAYVLRADGKLQRLTASTSNTLPDATALLGALHERLKQGAADGAYRATAIFVDVVARLPDGEESDAVFAGLEHEAGLCRNLYFPYHHTAQGVLVLADPLITSREGSLFGSCGRGPGSGPHGAGPS